MCLMVGGIIATLVVGGRSASVIKVSGICAAMHFKDFTL